MFVVMCSLFCFPYLTHSRARDIENEVVAVCDLPGTRGLVDRSIPADFPGSDQREAAQKECDRLPEEAIDVAIRIVEGEGAWERKVGAAGLISELFTKYHVLEKTKERARKAIVAELKEETLADNLSALAFYLGFLGQNGTQDDLEVIAPLVDYPIKPFARLAESDFNRIVQRETKGGRPLLHVPPHTQPRPEPITKAVDQNKVNAPVVDSEAVNSRLKVNNPQSLSITTERRWPVVPIVVAVALIATLLLLLWRGSKLRN